MRFDLIDLRLFLHVVEAENITHGAERAGLALASASERIRGMEFAGGTPLLERRPRGVRPTPAGLAVAHHARVVLGQLEQMRGELAQYAKGLRGHVRLLSNTTAQAEFLPEVLASFLAANSNIDVDIEERTSREIVPAIAGGFADVGIVADSVELGVLESLFFRPDRLVLVVPGHHAFASRGTIEFKEALAEPFVGLHHGSPLQALIAGHAARTGVPMKLRVRLGALEAVCRSVESGVGIAVVPEVTACRVAERAEISLVRLADAWTSRNLLICARNFEALPLQARLLVEHLVGERVAAA